jgi:hypothetical protein
LDRGREIHTSCGEKPLGGTHRPGAHPDRGVDVQVPTPDALARRGSIVPEHGITPEAIGSDHPPGRRRSLSTGHRVRSGRRILRSDPRTGKPHALSSAQEENGTPCAGICVSDCFCCAPSVTGDGASSLTELDPKDPAGSPPSARPAPGVPLLPDRPPRLLAS